MGADGVVRVGFLGVVDFDFFGERLGEFVGEDEVGDEFGRVVIDGFELAAFAGEAWVKGEVPGSTSSP